MKSASQGIEVVACRPRMAPVADSLRVTSRCGIIGVAIADGIAASAGRVTLALVARWMDDVEQLARTDRRSMVC